MDYAIKQYLLENGMNKQAVEGKTANRIVELMLRMFAGDEKADANVFMERQIDRQREESESLATEIDNRKSELKELIDFKKEMDDVLSPRAKEAVVLYQTLVGIGNKKNADPDVSVRNAGFIVYAYLGGKARTIINADDAEEDDYWDE